MKIIHNTAVVIVFCIIGVPISVSSMENTDKNANARSISAGIGFPEYSQAFQAQIGLGIGAFPEYEGSDKYAATALPLFNIREQGAYFIKGASINANEGLASAGITLLHLSYSEKLSRRFNIVMGPLIRAYGGRKESDSDIDILDGLGDIDRSVGIGAFIEYSAGTWLANLSVSPQDAGNDNDGTLATFDIVYTTYIKDVLRVSTALSISWADDDYMQAYYGVTDSQSVQSGFLRFDSKSGFKDIGIQLKAAYEVSPRWAIEGQLGYWRYLNDAADSQIVKDEGSVNQIRGLVGLSYQF